MIIELKEPQKIYLDLKNCALWKQQSKNTIKKPKRSNEMQSQISLYLIQH